MTASYDTISKGYTITTAGRTQTFLPADIDAALSDARIAVYVKKNATTTDSLTRTKAGTSGRFNYEYVGGGYWQRTIDGTSTISGSLDAFAYGMKTPDAAVPRTGRVEYSVDLLGAETTASNVFGITGQGLAQVDFSTGTIVTHGSFVAPISGNTIFSSEAKLSSSDGSFGGSFRFDDLGQFTGALNGNFFGPAAEEIGAAFFASQTDGRIAVGTIIGRGTAVSTTNASIVAPASNEFFTNNATTVAASLDTATGQFSAQSQGGTPLIVNYDAARQKYTLITNGRSEYFSPSNSIVSGSTDQQLTFTALAGYQFVRGAQWRKNLRSGTSIQYTLDNFAFGVETTDLALPRSGIAGYATKISGAMADGDFGNLLNFSGKGTLTTDFAAGTLNWAGGVQYFEEAPVGTRQVGVGSLTGSATLSSAANIFSGTVNLDGVGPYTGSIDGRFYGPAANEIGGAFAVSDGVGGVASGVLLGQQDANVLGGRTPLSALSQLTVFDNSRYLLIRTGFVPAISSASSLALDPVPQTYTFTATGDGIVPAQISFGPAELLAAQSDATFSRYGVSDSGTTATVSIFNAASGNPAIALTYTSFADINLSVPNAGGTLATQYYYPFGIETLTVQLPQFGTGTYSGIIHGRGSVIPIVGSQQRYSLQGTSRLTVDFGTALFSDTLNVTGIDSVTGASVSLGSYSVSGSVGTNNVLTGADFVGTGVVGDFRGSFFGPNAAEYGAVFTINKTDVDGNRTGLNGVTVGKRD